MRNRKKKSDWKGQQQQQQRLVLKSEKANICLFLFILLIDTANIGGFYLVHQIYRNKS